MSKFHVKTEYVEDGRTVSLNQNTLDLDSLNKDLHFQYVDLALINLKPDQLEELKTNKCLTIKTDFTKLVTIKFEE